MSEEEQLKLQSYLDGELAEKERREVERCLDADENARLLLQELRTTRQIVRANESERKLDCTREFYWNGIAREIERSEVNAVRNRDEGVFGWLRHYAAQLVGAAAGIAVVAFTFTALTSEPEVDSSWEVLDPNLAMVNYSDYENGITVVMLYDQSTPAFTEGD